MNNNKNFCPFIKGDCHKDCTFYRKPFPGENQHACCTIQNHLANDSTSYRLSKIENNTKEVLNALRTPWTFIVQVYYKPYKTLFSA